MPEIRYAEQFIEDASSIQLASKRGEVRRRIEQLAGFPEIGSANLPVSIVERFGGNVRKLVVNPFIVVYEIDQENDAVNVLGLIHQRAAW